MLSAAGWLRVACTKAKAKGKLPFGGKSMSSETPYHPTNAYTKIRGPSLGMVRVVRNCLIQMVIGYDSSPKT